MTISSVPHAGGSTAANPRLPRFNSIMLLLGPALAALAPPTLALIWLAAEDANARMLVMTYWPAFAALTATGIGLAAFLARLASRTARTRQRAADSVLADSEARFRQLTSMASDWYWEADIEHRFTTFVGRTNIAQSELDRLMRNRRWEVPGHAPIATTWEAHVALIEARQPFSKLLIEVVLPDGRRSFRHVSGQPRLDAQSRFAGYRGVGSDATDATLASAIAAGERRMFEALAAGQALDFLLNLLADGIEKGLARKGLVSIHMVRNGRLEAVAAPHLPHALRTALGIVAIESACGSCANAAALHAPVAVHDIASDPRWAAFGDTALAAGVASSWSTPVINAEDEVLATLCVYHHTPADPLPRDRTTVARMVDLVGLLVQRFRAEADLRRSEARFRQLATMSSDWFWEQDENYRFVATEALVRTDNPLGDLIGTTRWDNPGTRPIGATWEQHRADLEARRPFAHLVLALTTAAGVQRHVAVRGEPIFDASGRFTGYRGVGADITDRYRAEAALRKSEARFRQLTELGSDWYWEQDAEYRFIRVTGGELRKDLPYNTTVGFRRWERPSLQPVGFTWEQHERDLDARRSFTNLILQYTDPRSARNYWSLRGEPVFDDGGDFTGYRGVGTDITERHRLDLRRAGERRLFELLTSGATLERLLSELCASIEPAMARPAVATVQVLTEGVVRQVAGPALPAAYRIAQGERVSDTLPFICAAAIERNETVIGGDFDSDPRWIDWLPIARACGFKSAWATPVRGASGQALATLTIHGDVAGEPLPEDLDISAAAAALSGVLLERFNAEAAQRASEARYRGLVEFTQEGVLIDDNGLIVYANPALARIMHAADGGILRQMSLIDMIAPESRELVRARVARIIAGETLPPTEIRLLALDGSEVDVESSGAMIEIDGRRLTQTYIRDISARKLAARELQRLNESLEQRVAERTAELTAANRELEAFSYTVAHDLRAPLRAIDGFATMLREEAGQQLAAHSRRDLQMITVNTRRMAELIDGLLEFSRLSRSDPTRRLVPMGAMVDAIIADTASRAAHRPAFVIGELAPVEGDASMLRQVWINLIANAIKFTARAPNPRIDISCRREAGFVIFSVRDNGAGFDPRYQSKLFGIFQRLHAQADYDGTGVGLAIVKRIVERHHGQVSAEGNPGRGATFHFSLPAA